MSEETTVRTLAVGAFNLRRSLALQRLGKHDPTAIETERSFTKTFFHRGRLVRASLAYDGARLRLEAPSDVVWAERVDDGYASFAPTEPLLRRLHQGSGLRVMPFPWLYDLAAGAVLQQRVDFAEACRSWRAIVERMGGGVSLPAASELARQPLWRFSELRIDGQRARTLLALAKEEAFARFLHLGTPRDLLLRRLGRLPGIGPWTLGMLTGFGLGDPDALILGDLHLPRIVCELLAPDAPVSEARMVEALEPFAGQRFRVSRLLVSHAIAERRRRG